VCVSDLAHASREVFLYFAVPAFGMGSMVNLERGSYIWALERGLKHAENERGGSVKNLVRK
jgi:hypothetical protein